MKKSLLYFLFCLSVSLFVNQSRAQTILYTEDFSSETLPSGWTNDSLGFTPMNVWLFTNPYQNGISGAGFDTSYAIFDSDEGSVDDEIDEYASLTTGDIDISTATGAVFLEMDEQYRPLSGPSTGGSSRRIEISTNSGSSWITIVYDSMAVGYPDTMDAAHTQYALATSGAANVRVRFTWTGSWDWWWAIDNVQIIDYPVSCNTTPNGGTAGSSLSSACSFNIIDLTVIGADSTTGTTFQWEVSTDNVNWTDITGATFTVTSVTGQTVASYYRLRVSCGGFDGYSTVVTMGQNPPLDCYCIPVYFNGCDALGKVAINTLLNESMICDGAMPDNYTLFPDTGSLTTDLGTGDYYDVTIASAAGSGTHGAGIWFDFNADGDFKDAGEFTNISDTIPENSGDFVMNINIPPTAVLGPTRMRVRYIFNAPVVSSSDCSGYSYGETEDYTVNIVLGTGVKNNPLQAIKVYPVPANDRLFIQSPVQGAMQITLFDQTGRICRDQYATSNSTEMNVSDLASGIYFLRFETEKNTITKKVILN